MAPLVELQRDKSFRIRLMAICFSVAFLVSAIYVAFSYHLSTDLGIEIEKTSLHRQAILLHAEIIEADEEPEKRLDNLVNVIYLNDHFRAEKLYIEAYGAGLLWSLNHQIPSYQISHLKKQINAAIQLRSISKSQQSQTKMFDGIEVIDNQHFLWQTIEGQDRKIIVVKLTNSNNIALSLIVKHLFFVSLIVLIIVACLTVLLSFWMDKRVQSKNDALARLATYDRLTGLPNRLYLINVLQKIMPESLVFNQKKRKRKRKKKAQQKNIHGCLFVIDLDNFKKVNDVFGHSAGDELLKEISQRLSTTIGNRNILARIGGDEFVVWADNMDIKHAIDLAKKLVAVCNEPVTINQLAIGTGVSVGISSYPVHASNIDTLILCADVAMNEAKKTHTGWGLFDIRDSERNSQRLRLRNDLTKAFSRQEIHLYYQPKVALHSGEVVGLEALSRWHHPIDGVLYPDSFISIIEQSGRVQEFGRYVVQTAIKQLEMWKQQGINIPVAINLSPYNLLDLGLLNFILKQLDDSNISPNTLEIELVESSTSINIEQISEHIHEFKQAGIKFAIDDFGTGMSSLSYVNNLNVDLIKIDRSFINGIEKEPTKQAIIFTAVTLAQSFDTGLLAEGIENEDQANLLMGMGCYYGQGYYYAKPMPVEQIEPILISKAKLPIK